MMTFRFNYVLAPYATQASESRGRLISEPPSATRTPYQRDRDRIVHSGAFRKMRNKTQVFIESEGDYYRTRLTHSLEVAQIARSVSRALGFDEDLSEAIALAHDLGHTCFGHAGEEGLDAAMKRFGGFDHNEQTFRILTKLERRYARFDGLNLTWETLEGVAKHNGPIGPDAPLPAIRAFSEKWDLELGTYAGPEAQVAALADDIAYNTHDADDGLRAGYFSFDDVSTLPLFGEATAKMKKRYPDVFDQTLMFECVREVIGDMVNDVLATTRRNLDAFKPRSAADIRCAGRPTVCFSEDMSAKIDVIRQFLRARMYNHENVNIVRAKARRIVSDLFDCYMKQPDCLPSAWCALVSVPDDEAVKARYVSDYIAGMTDRYALQEHRRIFSDDMAL